MAVAPTATLRGVSPRKPDTLPDDAVAALLAAQAAHVGAHEALKAAVRDALKRGSVRQVAKALGISTATVMAWSKATP